jgi:hypothetical protein
MLHVARLLYHYHFVTKLLSVTQITKPNFKPSATYDRLLPVGQTRLCMKQVTGWRAAAELGVTEMAVRNHQDC